MRGANRAHGRLKPHIKLAESKTAEGKVLTLHSHDGNFSLRVDGRELMHSAVTASEMQLGELAADHVAGSAKARVLIGGLGLGFTLKSVLTAAGPQVDVVVAELFPEVLEWNRTHMRELNGAALEDPRTKIIVDNV